MIILLGQSKRLPFSCFEDDTLYNRPTLLDPKRCARYREIRDDIQMHIKTGEIRKAMEGRMYNCALALTLTLPDVCAKVEYGKTSKENYIKWFNSFAKSKFTVLATHLPDNAQVPYTTFTGEDCYALRCAYLHAGNFVINDSKTLLKRVRLHVHIRNDQYYHHFYRSGDYADCDLFHLCSTICDAVDEYYESIEDKERFWVDEVQFDTW